MNTYHAGVCSSMNKHLKIYRIASQLIFFGLFIFIFIRSLDPFSTLTNPFLRFDPLIFLTHLTFWYRIILPIVGILVATLIVGRFFCGWVCPLGSLIDGLDLIFLPVRRMGPFRKVSEWLGKQLVITPPSWFILGAVLVTVFFTPPALQFFHPNVWIVRMFSLSVAGIVFLIFLMWCASTTRRLWCTHLCPLGALYGLLSKVAIFRLNIQKCSGCKLCDSCPMHASDYKTRHIHTYQCILCFDYEGRCPVHGFTFQRSRRKETKPDESRRRFLKSGAVFVSGILVGAVLSRFDRTVKTKLLRPPGVTDEPRFVERCLRCFQCVESCPNEIIKITGPGAGLDNLFTPHLDFRKNGCDYNCQVCQLVCPNFAIPMQSLQEKQKSTIGLAKIDESICVVFAKDINCLVCEEFCPVPYKAIEVVEREKMVNGELITLRYPVVDPDLCIGCGLCEAFCPVVERAIRVYRK